MVGTALGMGVSAFYIPSLQLGSGPARIPPFVVEIAWPVIFEIYLLFGLFLLLHSVY